MDDADLTGPFASFADSLGTMSVAAVSWPASLAFLGIGGLVVERRRR